MPIGQKKRERKRKKKKKYTQVEEQNRDFAIVCDDCVSYKGRPQYQHFWEKLVSLVVKREVLMEG